MTPEQMEKCREAFEREIAEAGVLKSLNFTWIDCRGGEYHYFPMQKQWLLWQAAWSAAQAQGVEEIVWQDRADEHTADIHDALIHQPRDHTLYGRAFEMVSNRHSKFALVHLVYWLLTRTPPQQPTDQAFVEYRAHGGKLDFTEWQEKQEKGGE